MSAEAQKSRYCYYGTFVSGLQEVIAEIVRERLSDIFITKILDGAIIFETRCSYDKLNFFCFNNIFLIIDILHSNKQTGNSPPLTIHMKKIADMASAGGILNERSMSAISENSGKIKTFRLVCSDENKPAPANETVKCRVERFICDHSSLQVNRSGPDTEFWFLYRREGFSLFMKRLTRQSGKKIHPGEIPPQLAWLLCRIGNIPAGGIIIDPFCGYGSIPEAALKHFHISKIHALDTEKRCIKIAQSKRSLKTERCEIRQADFFTASGFLPDYGADAIITDPPWGMYRETSIPLAEFYEKMLNIFQRLLKPGGCAVILTGAEKEFESAAEKICTLHKERTIRILVSGKKAAVFILVKK